MNNDKKLSYFIGAGFILALIFIRAETHIDIRYFKDWMFILITACVVFFWGIRPDNKLLVLPVIVIYAFLRVKASASFPIFYQYIMMVNGLTLLYALGNRNISIKIVLNSLLVVSLVSSIWVILENYSFDIQTYLYRLIGLDHAVRMRIVGDKIVPVTNLIPQGPLGQHTLTGALISCCIPVYFRKKYFVLLPIIIWAIYLCNSAMSVICAIGAVFLLFLLTYRKLMWLLLPISTVPFVLYGTFPIFFSDNGRIAAWKDIISSYGFNFWGSGPGWLSATSTVVNQAGQIFKHAHCEILDLYISLGIPGLIMFGYLLSRVRITNKYIFTIFIALLVNSFTNLTYHISLLSFITIVCYSILTRKK